MVTVIVSSGASPESSWWSEDKVGIGREKTLPEWLRVATEERGGDLMSLNRSEATLPLTRVYFFLLGPTQIARRVSECVHEVCGCTLAALTGTTDNWQYVLKLELKSCAVTCAVC